MTIHRHVLAFVVAAFVAMPTGSFAQTERGAVSGIVTDQTKAAVPGASIKVINTGSQSALLWTAIQGRAARSSRTCTGRVAARIAAVNGIRVPGAGVGGRGEALDGVGRDAVGRAAAGSAVFDGSVKSSSNSGFWVARYRRRASARAVLLARATVSPGACVDLGDGVERIVVDGW